MMRGLVRSIIREALLRRLVESYEPLEKQVLLIRPDHLGDLLFVRPALQRIREALPGWHITLMVGPWSETIVADEKNVDEIVAFPFPGFTRAGTGNPLEPYQLLFEAAGLIRERRPTAVVVLRDDHWWGALAAQQAGAPLIVGSAHPAMRDLLTDVVSVDGFHAVARNTVILDHVARQLGSTTNLRPVDFEHVPLIWRVKETERQRARHVLAERNVEQRFVVIHPGSGAQVKLWPAERWAGVVDRIAAGGHSVVLTGSESELPLLRRIASLASASHSLGGQTSIGELAAVFEQAQAVLGVDSGPLHLAVATDTPTIHLYGPSDVGVYGPWGDPARHRVLRAGLTCPACGNLDPSRPEGSGCMLAIQLEHVVDTFNELVGS